MNPSPRPKIALACALLLGCLIATSCASTSTTATTTVAADNATETEVEGATGSTPAETPTPAATPVAVTPTVAAADNTSVEAESEIAAVPQETSAPVPDGSTLNCVDDFDTILDVTTAGIPLFSYDRVETLDGLLDRTHAVITAELTSLHPVGQGGALMGFDGIEVIAGTSSLATSAEFLSNTLFPHREDPQLTNPIGVQGVNVIVFIDEFDFAQYGIVVDIQGLAFQCSSDSPRAIIEPLPQELQGLTISDITALIRAS